MANLKFSIEISNSYQQVRIFKSEVLTSHSFDRSVHNTLLKRRNKIEMHHSSYSEQDVGSRVHGEVQRRKGPHNMVGLWRARAG
jgi:hypothetical protein